MNRDELHVRYREAMGQEKQRYSTVKLSAAREYFAKDDYSEFVAATTRAHRIFLKWLREELEEGTKAIENEERNGE
jgi:hypothetical protein